MEINKDLTAAVKLNSPDDERWINHAIKLAKKAELIGEVPVGAVIVRDNEILGEGWNQPISNVDPTAHAEIIAIRQAALAIHNYRIVDATIYVTLEPCSMCVGALIHARIARLVFGAYEAKAGAVQSQAQLLDAVYVNHKVKYTGGILKAECQHQLTHFFSMRRAHKKLSNS